MRKVFVSMGTARRARVALGVAVLTAAAVARERTAAACGAAYPGGPVFCTMADAPTRSRATPPPPVHLAASWSYTSTTLTFGGRRARLERHAAFVGTELGVAGGASIRFGAGGVLGGRLTPAGGRADFGPGVTAYFGAAKSVVDEGRLAPFVQIAGTFSFSRVATRGPAPNEAPVFTALDLRGAVTAGKTLGPVALYGTARVFGGPIFYRYAGDATTGTDLYKYQLGGGLSAMLPNRLLDVFVEGIALGERGLSAGVGATF